MKKEKLIALRDRIAALPEDLTTGRYYEDGKCACVVAHMADMIEDESLRVRVTSVLQANNGENIEEISIAVGALASEFGVDDLFLDRLQYENDTGRKARVLPYLDNVIEGNEA
jgi:hypothetical protein